jgi:hypothetical protein
MLMPLHRSVAPPGILQAMCCSELTPLQVRAVAQTSCLQVCQQAHAMLERTT